MEMWIQIYFIKYPFLTFLFFPLNWYLMKIGQIGNERNFRIYRKKYNR